MQTISAIAAFGLAALASAQSTGLAPAAAPSSCQSSYTQCTSAGAYGVDCVGRLATCRATCETRANACRTGPGANQALCSAQYAGCLGYDPYAANAPNSTTTVVAVVMSYTTYCPAATTFTNNGQVYTATGPGYVTVTNCPCTVTSTGAVPAPTTPGAKPAASTGTNNGTYTGPKYTGAGNKLVGAGLSIVAAGAGIFAFAL